MGQDDNDQFAGLAVYLATDYFLDHQSKDVRLLVACCLADVFRIFAPEAPFRDVKQLKVKRLKTLKFKKKIVAFYIHVFSHFGGETYCFCSVCLSVTLL